MKTWDRVKPSLFVLLAAVVAFGLLGLVSLFNGEITVGSIPDDIGGGSGESVVIPFKTPTLEPEVVVPTEVIVPTSTPTLVPTVEPTLTPTAIVCLELDVLELNGVEGLKAETFITLEESMFEQVALYNEVNGTDLVPRSLIETFGECEAPEGGFKVVPLTDDWGNLTGQYFILDRDGYCLLESGCDIVFYVADYSLITHVGKTTEELVERANKFSRLGGTMVLMYSHGDGLINLLHLDDEHRGPPQYFEPIPFMFLVDDEFFLDDYKWKIQYSGFDPVQHYNQP